MGQKSFTLIELMVVIAIVGLIASIVLVSLRGARQRARIAAGMQFSDSLRAGLSDAITGWWSLDEGTGNTAGDTWGGNNGTIYGDNYWTTEGIREGALSCSGNDYVRINNVQVDTASGAQNTVEFWMNWTGTNSQMPMGWDIYDLWLIDGCFGFNTSENNALGVSWDGLVNNWIHVAAIFYNGAPSSTNNELYINGKKQSIYWCRGSGGSSSSVTTTVQISGWPTNAAYRFSGLIDEFKIYNRGLTALEIQKRYAEGLEKYKDFVLKKL
ncbi:prepilin-type N-terminal cleavage/methylation domain-containing protein [Patescibacteria group bacterium]|nr:prepilin-type N-terminal cleavage/methylation domain-containing protein [Patescibacteria group bacterium]